MITENNSGGQKEKEPPEKIKTKTFEDFDKLDLESFAAKIFADIENGLKDPQEEGAYTVSLDAAFGFGKTTFIEMFNDFINGVAAESSSANHNKGKEGYSSFIINAWQSDYHNEPIISIIPQLVQFIESQEKQSTSTGKRTKNLAKKGRRFLNKHSSDLLKLIAGFVSEQIPFGRIAKPLIDTILNIIRKKIFVAIKGNQSVLGEEIFNDFTQREEIIEDIKKEIIAYMNESDKKIIIIVDELDRARPDYAIHFLEAVKHFFDIKGLCFLFTVNRDQLKETAKSLFGQGMDFDRYYQKFFKSQLQLPALYDCEYAAKPLPNFKNKHYPQGYVLLLPQKAPLLSFIKEHKAGIVENVEDEVIFSIAQLLALTPREIEEWFRHLKKNSCQ